MKTVTFCRNSDILLNDMNYLEKRLYCEVENLIKNGAVEFLLGGYGSFDYLSAKIVKKLKEKYPHIKSILVIPYLNREYDMSLYDISEYPPIETVPLKFAISKRNQYMVNCSDVIIAFVKNPYGCAAKTLEYAKRKKKNIILLS